MKKKILIVVGTRPNFIKVTQFKKIAQKFTDLDIKIVHTGQHFDSKMADVFFKQFDLIPDYYLDIGYGSAIEQMAQIMMQLEKLIQSVYFPDLLISVGDVNSTFAGALVAKKLNIKLAHLESGLRSFDDSMPEETNRILTDELSDYFFVTEKSGMDNLKRIGKSESQLFFVGNTMIDTLVAFKNEIMKSDILNELNLKKDEDFILMTMHRPATVDSQEGLHKLLKLLKEIPLNYKIVFPMHPRTRSNIEKLGLKNEFDNLKSLIFTEPLDYFSFQKLITSCKLIITDSGGIQEESTFVMVPCLTLRPNTERPITCSIGTNTLVPFDIGEILKQIKLIENNAYKKGQIPEFWDGGSTERIMEVIHKIKLK